MDEMCQDLGMSEVLKNAGRPVWSVEAFQKTLARKGLVQITIKNRSI